ncbi:MAG: site-specific integrase [Acidobacteriota bacterium]|nr:site-specific integrase [Acidobacteriota bacterium]
MKISLSGVRSVARTVNVMVCHSPACKHKLRGALRRNCKCLKSLLVYAGATGKTVRIYAKTRAWARAELAAQELRDSWDPRLRRLRELETTPDREHVLIERAVALYTADLGARMRRKGTMAMVRAFFGNVDFKTNEIKKNGHLFGWLEKLPLPTRPTFLADLTAVRLAEWRATWKFSDFTAAQRWGMVKSLFNFCDSMNWIHENPTRQLRRVEYRKGSRTAIFTDRQYESILRAVKDYNPNNQPASTLISRRQRLKTFLELMRWSGMSLIDAVQYRPTLVDQEGVLRYRRQKTGALATVQLPAHVIALLRCVPLERSSVGPSQPFRMRNFAPVSGAATWRMRLRRLFSLADLEEIRNEVGRVRPPHTHQLRDTFAVWNLRHGVPLYSLAKMLGHSNPVMVARSYLPWVKELENLTINEGRKALAAGKPTTLRSAKVVPISQRA